MLSQQQVTTILIKIFLGVLVLGAGLVAPLAGFTVFAAGDYPARYPITLFSRPVVYEQLTPDGPVGQKLAPNKLVGEKVVRHLRRQLSPERDFVTRISSFRQIYRELEPAANLSVLTGGDCLLRLMDRQRSEFGVFPCDSPAP